MHNKLKVLITGAGAPGGPGLIKAILKDRNIELYATDSNSKASGRFLLKENFRLVPKATDDNYIAEILRICRKLKIKVILPLVTAELPKLSLYKDTFKEYGITIIVSEKNDLNISNNKYLLYKHLERNNIKVPKYILVCDSQGLIDAAKLLGYPRFPVVMKPCIGNGSRGVRILSEQKKPLDLLFNEKPNSLFATLDQIVDIISENKIPELVVCEYLPDQEVTIDTIVADGRVNDCLIRERLTISNGISTAGEFIDNTEIESYIAAIVNSLPGLFGPVGFQVKKSSQSKFLLLECNPRIQGTSVSAMGLGVNLALRSIYFAIEKKIPPLGKRSGISFSRYYEEIYYES